MSAKGPQFPVVVRAEGVTEAERYLHRLCEHSFLSLWSYPSLFRDQRVSGKGDGKELCDLLVVFGDDLLIFSDKSCAFPNTGDIRLDWSRWFRKAVMEAAKQGAGAERWLRVHPERVYLDRACTQPFPLELPPADRMRVHQIVVAHNVADRCAKYFGGGSTGTLMFNSDLQGTDHHDLGRCQPFQVGWLASDRSFVHVLDDASLEIVLRNRDTITDFVEYVRAKEELLRSLRDRGTRFSYAGEEELLAHYLLTINGNRHGFSIPYGFDSISFVEGDWAAFQTSPQRRAQLAADRISYVWDELIETFNAHILGGTSYFATTPRIADRERILRFLAREPRVRRRMLAESLMGMLATTKPSFRATRVMLPSNPGDPHYCFLLLPRPGGRSMEEYREVRYKLLEALCCVTKVVFPEALDIVGLATETDIETLPRSEDALYLDARAWDDAAETHARDLQKDLRLLTNMTKFQDRVAEFPAFEMNQVVAPGRNPRNKPCPCGSGKKYKKCHGK